MALVGDLLHGLAFIFSPQMAQCSAHTDAPEQAHVVVDLGDRADRSIAGYGSSTSGRSRRRDSTRR
jgi:hypothetical protein